MRLLMVITFLSFVAVTPLGASDILIADLATSQVWDVSAALCELAGLEQIANAFALNPGGTSGDAYLLVDDGTQLIALDTETFFPDFSVPRADILQLLGLPTNAAGLFTTYNPDMFSRIGAADVLTFIGTDGTSAAFDFESQTVRNLAEFALPGEFQAGFGVSGQADTGVLWREALEPDAVWQFSNWLDPSAIPVPLADLAGATPVAVSQLMLPSGNGPGLLFLTLPSAGTATPTPTPTAEPTETPTPTPGTDGVAAYAINGLGETISAISSGMPREIDNNIVQTGIGPNQILLHDNEVYVVNSMNNSISVYSVIPLVLRRQLALGDGANPFMMAFADNDRCFVSLLMTNRVAIVHRYAGIEQILELPSSDELPRDPGTDTYARPEAVALVNGLIYVACANLDAAWTAGGPGVVCVFDPVSGQRLRMIESCGRNTVGLHTDPAQPDVLFVMNAGDYQSGSGYIGNGTIGAFDVQLDDWRWIAPCGEAPLEAQTAGGILVAANARDGQLLRLDVETGAVLPPVMLPVSGGGLSFVSGLAADAEGRIWATEFNHDHLYLIDPVAPAIIEGPYILGDGPDGIVTVR